MNMLFKGKKCITQKVFTKITLTFILQKDRMKSSQKIVRNV